MATAFIGTATMIRRLNTEIDKIKGATQAGLLAACHKIQEYSDATCPYETGNLINSGYVQETDSGGAEVGYTAKYAPFVHEMVNNYHKPPTRALFLQKAIEENVPELVSIIKRHAEQF